MGKNEKVWINRLNKPPIVEICPGTRIYTSKDEKWKIYRQDIGMGEYEYALFFNDTFLCRSDKLDTVKMIKILIDSRGGD